MYAICGMYACMRYDDCVCLCLCVLHVCACVRLCVYAAKCPENLLFTFSDTRPMNFISYRLRLVPIDLPPIPTPDAVAKAKEDKAAKQVEEEEKAEEEETLEDDPFPDGECCDIHLSPVVG